ncbi:MAG: hypothetical protein JXA43_01915 [Candidatus Diapherotrites archaeon]|nr:hypothetical protein [Candidatus Diapherotrites archaeon]
MFHSRGFYQPLLVLLILSMMLIVFGNLYQHSLSVQKVIGAEGTLYERPVLVSAATCSGSYYLVGNDLSTDGIMITNTSTENIHEVHVYHMSSSGVTEKLEWLDGGIPISGELPELIAGESVCFQGTETVLAHSSFFVVAAEGATKLDVAD